MSEDEPGWRMRKMCEHCPFRPDTKAYYLRPERFQQIKDASVMGSPFYCHDSVFKRGKFRRLPRSERRECAGALAYREAEWKRSPTIVADMLAQMLEEIKAERAAKTASRRKKPES